ncbi:MAG TPA: GNAT family protein [Micromonosporaceae bacterium]|nr:GNAT family protein [Micromonosporaceae bacterium]
MAHPYWPVFDIRLHLDEVGLRPVTEADLVPLARIRPADVETDPRLPTFRPGSGEPDPHAQAGTSLHQSYWSSLGSWRPESWRLGFAVEVGGELAGVQEIEAAEFAVRRTVESASWLAPQWRGRGVGKAMRLAVLALAFDALAAQAAETEAWHDNAASLRVSRALGYVDNGVTRHPRGDHAEDMPRLRMTRAVWLSRHAGHKVRIDGVDPCRHFFGIG